jgi:hypothetical protein
MGRKSDSINCIATPALESKRSVPLTLAITDRRIASRAADRSGDEAMTTNKAGQPSDASMNWKRADVASISLVPRFPFLPMTAAEIKVTIEAGNLGKRISIRSSALDQPGSGDPHYKERGKTRASVESPLM